MPGPLRNIFDGVWHAKVYEPVKRNKDGMRWIMHRFQIKGGISFREAMMKDMFEPNKLIRLIGGTDARAP